MLRIGLLIHDVDSEYARELIAGTAEFCSQHSLAFFVFPARSKNWPYGNFDYQYQAVAAHISAYNLDGLILATGTQSHYVTQEELFAYFDSFKPLPMVSIGYEVPGMPNVVVDCLGGFSRAISHMIKVHGRRRIALITSLGNSAEVVARNNVYYKVLENAQIPIDRSIVFNGDFEYSVAYGSLERYYREHKVLDFDAIIAINDDMAYGAVDFCFEHGYKIPEDIAVLGFDDTKKAAFTSPALSSMNQQIAVQAEKAVSALLQLINGKKPPMLQTVQTNAMLRQSCGCVSQKELSVMAVDVDGNVINCGIPKRNAGEWYIRKNQLNKIMAYRLDMQASLTIEQLRRQIHTDIAKFDISAAAICLFAEPVVTEKFSTFTLPNKAYVFSAFDEDMRFYADTEMPYTYFNPCQTMVPDGFLSLSAQRSYVMPLFCRTLQYGYIVYRPGSFDNQLYEILATILADIIIAAIAYSESLREKEQLAEQNESLSNYNKKLSLMSRTDEMTQLLNRRGLLALGQQTLNIAVDMHQSGLVIYGDMDGLKLINDTYGHDAGDRAIQAEAQLLRSVFRASDIIGRMGGDEFAIISVGMTPEVFNRIQERLNKLCSEWNESTNELFTLSISLGYAQFSIDEYSLQALLTEADMNQYEEKRRKKLNR